MIAQEKTCLQYSPCLFEIPLKNVMNGKVIKKGWLCSLIWIIIGLVCLTVFMLGLHHWNSSVNWFTTLYFVGGIGWVPAAMCGLSRAYYKMCQGIYPYLDEPEETLAEYYKTTANSIFGYLKNNVNVFISVVIWAFMLITVIVNNASFSNEYTAASKFIYSFYILVGIIFTCVPCAVVRFLQTLFSLKKYKLKTHALYQRAGEQFQKVHMNCTRLIWCITVLLIMLSIAMLKSPYQEALWLWLPVFGFAPLGLFIMNNSMTKSLINTALIHEESALQERINNILQRQLIEQESNLLYTLLGIQDKLREYTQAKSALANNVVLIFTVLSGLGSVVAAGFSIFSDKSIIQSILALLRLTPKF